MGKKRQPISAATRKPLSLKTCRSFPTKQGRFSPSKILKDEKENTHNIVGTANPPDTHVQKATITENKPPQGSHLDRSEWRRKVEAAVAAHTASKAVAAVELSNEQTNKTSTEGKEDIGVSKHPSKSAATCATVVLILLVVVWSVARVVLLNSRGSIHQLSNLTQPKDMNVKQDNMLLFDSINDSINDPTTSPVNNVWLSVESSEMSKTSTTTENVNSEEIQHNIFFKEAPVFAPVIVKASSSSSGQVQKALSGFRKLFQPLQHLIAAVREKGTAFIRGTMHFLKRKFNIDSNKPALSAM